MSTSESSSESRNSRSISEYKVNRRRQHGGSVRASSKSSNKDSLDSLPIVEIRPFVKRVWQREKSLPVFYDKSESRTSERDGKDTNKHEGQPSPSPSPHQLEHVVGTLSDGRPNSLHSNGSVVKSRMKIHPAAEVVQSKRSEHFQSLVPGNFTRGERTRTTLIELNHDDSPSRKFSCLKQALKHGDISGQQEIKCHGAKMSQVIGRRHLEYTNPYLSVNGVSTSWQANVHDGALRALLDAQKSSIPRKTSLQRAKTPFYDHLDRTGMLPSINIRHESLQNRQHGSGLQDRVMDKGSQHTVGGIKNSLDVLSKHGKPTKVERQITFELEINLSRFRKSRDYFPFEITPLELAKYYPQTLSNMTQGEALLRKGLEGNASRRRKRIGQPAHAQLEARGHGQQPKQPKADTGEEDSGTQSPFLDIGGGYCRQSPTTTNTLTPVSFKSFRQQERSSPEHQKRFHMESEYSPRSENMKDRMERRTEDGADSAMVGYIDHHGDGMADSRMSAHAPLDNPEHNTMQSTANSKKQNDGSSKDGDLDSTNMSGADTNCTPTTEDMDVITDVGNANSVGDSCQFVPDGALNTGHVDRRTFIASGRGNAFSGEAIQITS
jgi:hypothetical protein